MKAARGSDSSTVDPWRRHPTKPPPICKRGWDDHKFRFSNSCGSVEFDMSTVELSAPNLRTPKSYLKISNRIHLISPNYSK